MSATCARRSTARSESSRSRPCAAPAESGGGFAQLLPGGGGVLDPAGGLARPPLTRAELEAAARDVVVVDRQLPGIEGTARLLARPAGQPPAAVVAVGQSLDDRDETPARLAASFSVGGAGAGVGA